jgi:hypothetical protein
MLRILAILSLLALAVAPAAAGDGKLDRATLKGLKAVSVVADPPPPEIERRGITAAALEAEMERRLNQAGIAVDRNAVEFLGLSATSTQEKKTPAAVSLALGMYQAVALVRDKEIRTATATWGASSLGLFELKTPNQAILRAVDLLVDRFIDAFQAANPR